MEKIEKIYFLWKKGNELEMKFASYQGYRQNSIIEWKKQTGLSWSIIFKLLSQFEIYNAPKIRNLIRQVVLDNENVFNKPNCYVTGFGNTGKSGDIILYDFSHTNHINQSKIIKSWEIQSLPPKSTIIFVEDIIGTGSQSVEYINDKLNLLLSPSHDPYIFSLCASPIGISNLKDNTNFKVIYGQLLEEKSHQFYSNDCKYFSIKEKEQIKEANNLLKRSGTFDYDLGLLLAFYFAIPNNTMPIFWKDNYNYKDSSGIEKKWKALLPRQF